MKVNKKDRTITQEMKTSLINILNYIENNIMSIDTKEIMTNEKYPIDRMTEEIGKLKKIYDILTTEEYDNLGDVLTIMGAGNLCHFDDIEELIRDK